MKLIVDKSRKLLFTPTMPVVFFDFFTKYCNTKEKFYELLDEFEDYLYDSYKFCLNYSNEGFDYYYMMETFVKNEIIEENPFNWMLEYKKDRGHHNPFFSILTGNLNIKKIVPTHLEDFFHPVLNMHYIPEIPTDINYLENRKFTKKFVCFNARIENRFYRSSIFTFLKSINILDDCNYSFNSRGEYSEYPIIWFESKEEREKHESKTGLFNSSIEMPNSIPFTNSFCNIVTETYFDGNYDDSFRGSFFMSEKIYKPMISCQPFIVASSSNYLSQMKELGFKTFDKWWDESYDECENGVERLSKICRVIKKLSEKSIVELREIYLEMIPILHHNFNLTFKLPDLNPDLKNPTADLHIESKVMSKLLEH